MSQYSGSVHGSRDNLDERNRRNPPVPQARQPPTPTDRPYARQYVRNQPYNPNEPPPSYGQYPDQSREPLTGRYEERGQPRSRSQSPGRYLDERPQDQYFPSRSQSPSSVAGRYGERPAPRQQNRPPPRSQSPGRALDNEAYSPGYSPQSGHSGYAPSQSGYAPSQSGYAPSQSGYAPSQSGYAPSQSGYAPSQGGYAPSQGGGYAPQRGGYRPRGLSSSSGYGRPSQSSQYYNSRPPPTSSGGYQQFGYVKQKQRQKTSNRGGGYYNVYTDAVIKAKKMKTKGGVTMFLAVNRPWSKNHSNQPRDFMPLVIAAIFFNPLIGCIALVLSCITKNAVTTEDWAKAGSFGRITFYMALIAIITGIVFWVALIGSLHNFNVPPALN